MFYESASFKQYVAVNQRFADAIIAAHQEGDIIWVSGYHVPGLLRDSGKIPLTTPSGVSCTSPSRPRRPSAVCLNQWIQLLSQRYAGMKIVVGRDKLDEIQGVRHKINAFEYSSTRETSRVPGQGDPYTNRFATRSPHAHTPSHPLSEVLDVTGHRTHQRALLETYQPVVSCTRKT
ncbi:hypothetical protein C0992_010919 [Termitomyces sp. T32_za158]|nr:hypothetical protein C0992_010919 [Termitomyces sp. T32_za158]